MERGFIMINLKKTFLFLMVILTLYGSSTIILANNDSKKETFKCIAMKPICGNKIVLEKFLYNEESGIPFCIAFFDADISGKYTDITKNLICKSSDENIVKIGDLGLYANNSGNAVVTYTYGSINKKIYVTVVDPKPVKYTVSNESVVFANIGMSEYIQVFAEANTNEKIKVNHAAKWQSSNTEVATITENGWVIAIGEGNAEINIEINGAEKTIPVIVLSNEYNDITKAFLKEREIKEKQKSDEKNTLLRLTEDEEREDILYRCSTMLNYSWTPTQALPKWGAGEFAAYVLVTGIPYSQNSICDCYGTLTSGLTGYYSDGFNYALNNNSNFYTPCYKVIGNYTEDYPRYGSDCSGYASIAYQQNRMNTWAFRQAIDSDVEFHKVGTYDIDNPTATQLLAAYELLKKGDGLVYSYWQSSVLHGHVGVVGDNYGTSVLNYEQTPPKVQMVWRSYTSLANSDYLPFTVIE